MDPITEVENNIKDNCVEWNKCNFCKENINRSDELQHFEACKELPMLCFICESWMKRRELKKHILECSKRKFICIYKNIGCCYQNTQENLSIHLQEDNQVHLQLLIKELNELKKLIKDLTLRIGNFENDISDLKKMMLVQNNKLESLLEKQKNDISIISNDLSEKYQEFLSIKDLSLSRTSEQNTKITKIENKFSEELNNIKSKLSLMQKIDHNNEFIWKISDFKNKKEKGDILISESFYSSKCGYKFQIEIYPNGYGETKGTHLSIYFRLVSGEYDDILKWPFKGKVTFTCLNADKSENIRETTAYNNAVEKIASFSKPPKGGNNTSGWGYATFLTQEKPFSGNYVVDDTIFVLAGVKE